MALHEALNAAGRVPGPIVKSIAAGDINVTRTYSDRFDLDVAPAIPCTDAFGVIVQLRDFDTHRLWRRGELVYEGGHAKGLSSDPSLSTEMARRSSLPARLSASISHSCSIR